MLKQKTKEAIADNLVAAIHRTACESLKGRGKTIGYRVSIFAGHMCFRAVYKGDDLSDGFISFEE